MAGHKNQLYSIKKEGISALKKRVAWNSKFYPKFSISYKFQSSLFQYFSRTFIFLVMILTVYPLLLHRFLVLATRPPVKDNSGKSSFHSYIIFSYDLIRF